MGSLALLAEPLSLLTENFACICNPVNTFNRPHFAESGYWSSCSEYFHAYSRQSAFSWLPSVVRKVTRSVHTLPRTIKAIKGWTFRLCWLLICACIIREISIDKGSSWGWLSIWIFHGQPWIQYARLILEYKLQFLDLETELQSLWGGAPWQQGLWVFTQTATGAILKDVHNSCERGKTSLWHL